MMFRDIVKSMCGACCAAAMMCSSGVSEGMVVEGTRELCECASNDVAIYMHNEVFYRDAARREYAHDYNFSKWKSDGDRFLTQAFIDEYIKIGKAPLLNDGRPEFIEWLYGTSSNSIFFVGWDWETRYNYAKPFIKNMLDIYLKNTESFHDSIMQLGLMLEVLDSTEKM
jgi:hypothetical protein